MGIVCLCLICYAQASRPHLKILQVVVIVQYCDLNLSITFKFYSESCSTLNGNA